jgi:hypothetical protein
MLRTLLKRKPDNIQVTRKALNFNSLWYATDAKGKTPPFAALCWDNHQIHELSC